MKWGLILFVVIAGVLNTVQSGLNTTLTKTLDRPMWAIVLVSAVGLATSLTIALCSGQRPPSVHEVAQVPWWAWFGGVLGATYVLSMVLTADKLGAALFTGVAVTVAIVTSLVMDHFGLLGFEVHKAGVGRIAGGVLMIAGLALIARF